MYWSFLLLVKQLPHIPEVVEAAVLGSPAAPGLRAAVLYT